MALAYALEESHMWLTEKIHAPEIGWRWINSPPLTLQELRGRVVLVDFWDYTCVNCIRTLPYLAAWDRRYRPAGLSVIGVHAPEFHFARDYARIERAAREFGLAYPIVLDNEYQIWHAYANRCWPAKYLVDSAGYVRYCHFGEGAYHETEEAIQKLIREIRLDASLPALMEPVRGTDKPGARCAPVTPELYLGFKRGHIANSGGYASNEVKIYTLVTSLPEDVPCLDGPWFAGVEAITACPLENQPSRLLIRCRAAEVNLVMSPPEEASALVELWVDGKPMPRELAGEDAECSAGKCGVAVTAARMYRLLKSSNVESRLLEIRTSTPGLEAYAFTFVSCAE
ncbi:MAG: redoxin domain-containing protein [Terriglobia bacterium]